MVEGRGSVHMLRWVVMRCSAALACANPCAWAARLAAADRKGLGLFCGPLLNSRLRSSHCSTPALRSPPTPPHSCGLLLIQMHDMQQRGGSGGTLPLDQVEGSYLAAAQGALLGELRLEPLVMGLSDAYEQCRWGRAGLGWCGVVLWQGWQASCLMRQGCLAVR